MATGGWSGRWMLAVASIAMSTLAIVSLARHALLLRGFSTPVELVMAGYAAAMGALLGWAEPALQRALTWVGSSVEWRPTLYLHWRDMFVIVAIWTSALVWARWRGFAARWSAAAHDGTFGLHHILAFSFAFFVIIAGGLLMVIVSGVLPLRSSDLGTQLLIATSSWIVFAVVMSLGRFMRRNEALGMLVLAAIAALSTWWLSQAFGSSIGVGLAGFAVSVVIIGAMYLLFGAFLVLSDGTPFLKSPGIYGLYIVGGFIGTALLLAIDAVLRMLGA